MKKGIRSSLPPRYFFILFCAHSGAIIFRGQNVGPLFHGKIGRLNFRQRVSGESEAWRYMYRGNRHGKTKWQAARMHRSPEMLVDVLRRDFRRQRDIDRDIQHAFPKHICARARACLRPRYHPEFSVARDIAHKSVPRELAWYIQTWKNSCFFF